MHRACETLLLVVVTHSYHVVRRPHQIRGVRRRADINYSKVLILPISRADPPGIVLPPPLKKENSVSIIERLETACRRAGVLLGLAAALGLATFASGCDLGGRDHGIAADGGLDGGADGGLDGGTAADAGPDASFRDEDAGDTWVDEPVVIPGPCANDCAYTYNLQPRSETDPYAMDQQYGRSSLDVGAGATADVVAARETEKFLAFLASSSVSSAGYRQKSATNLVLDADTHDLVSGDAIVYVSFCRSLYYSDSEGGGIERTRRYEFSYDGVAGELTYSVASGDRRWERTIEAPEAPVVMLNHREYPTDTFGIHSPLTAMLLGERYDWGAGGVQRVPIFSPEMERIDAVELESTAADTLAIRFPLDGAKPPVSGADMNTIEVVYEYGIPVSMQSRTDFWWMPVYAPSVELNLPTPSGDAATAAFPAVPTGGAEITATSGDRTLHGVVDAPAEAGPHAAVVMVPGWDAMTRRGEVGAVDLYAQLAELVVENGGIAARFDARGAGDNGVAFSEATVGDLIDDAEAAVAAVQALPSVDPGRVFLLTTGAGAHVAAGAATGGAVSLAGIILIAPVGGDYVDAAALISARYVGNAEAWHSYPDAAASASTALFASLAGGTYTGAAYQGHTVAAWQSLFSRDLVANPVELPPTLILYGAEDHLIPQSLVDDLSAALAGKNPNDAGVALADGGTGGGSDVTTVVLPGLTHALTAGTAFGLWPEHGGAEAVDATAASAISDWLDGIAGGL
jgi:acetyl esterase/lipase